jgi:hypothetical protein
MTILSALMPTHAAIADSLDGRALSPRAPSPAPSSNGSALSPRAPSPEAARAVLEPPISFLKYIIFTDATGQEHPIIFSSAIQHSSLARYDMCAVSAGFVALHAGLVIIPEIPSTSLNLNPRPQDREILRTWLGLSCPSVPVHDRPSTPSTPSM